MVEVAANQGGLPKGLHQTQIQREIRQFPKKLASHPLKIPEFHRQLRKTG